MPKVWKVGSVVVLVIGLSLGVVLVQQKQNIFSQAWSGLTSNLEEIGLLQKQGLGPVDLPSTHPAQDLFHKLRLLYVDAEVQNIDLPQFSVRGDVFAKYDPQVNKTFIFSRLVNLPVVPGKIVRLWLAKFTNQYTTAGIAEFVSEYDQTVSYSVFSGPGDLRPYQELLFSYDSPSATRPESVVLTLKF